MRRLISLIALAALALTPGVSAKHGGGTLSRAPVVKAAAAKAPKAVPAMADPFGEAPLGMEANAPAGQDHAAFRAWLEGSPAARAQMLAFVQYLQREQVADVVPAWELVRTASMWRECGGAGFEVAPYTEWPHIAETLRFVREHVVPVIGKVDVVSGYRDEALNRCARGAPQSAHRHFYAVDLIPERPLSRAGLVRSLCSIHQWRGRAYEIGLGFYSGTRFHVDSKGFRKWGPDGSGSTSPCVTEV